MRSPLACRPRRSFLRGTAGAVLALPWLESLAEADAPTDRGAKPPQRAAFFYLPNGVLGEEFYPGAQRKPESKYAGPYDHLSSRTLKAVEGIGKKVTLISGLCRTQTRSSDPHEQGGSCWLSELAPLANPNRVPQGRTLDHIIAERIAGETPFRTLEFSCNPHTDNKESIRFDAISWFGPEHCARAMRDPVQVYRRLFMNRQAAPDDRITDLVLADAQAMSRQLGGADRDRLEEYLESIRSIELQMDRLSAMRNELARLNLPEPPAAHLPRGRYLELMGDFMVVALQSGLTRVATLMSAPERWDTACRFEEISDKLLDHHSLSHKGWSDNWRLIDEFYMSHFARMAAKMDSIREADGSTLLDNTMFTFGSGLSDGHTYNNLPIVIAGSGGGRFKTGVHLKCQKNTPLANLWLTQANAVGHQKRRFADSTGELTELLANQ